MATRAEPDVTVELGERIAAWATAIVDNDTDAIREFITPDWVLVTPSGIVGAERFLNDVDAGRLQHDSMSHQTLRVSACGHIAVITTRGTNTGSYLGEPITANEWTTNVFQRIDTRWRSSITHLTPIPQPIEAATT